MRCSLATGRALVDAHFAETISPRRERELRQHLPGCAACRAYYDRHLLISQLDPRARSAQDRLAAGLGIDPAKKRTTLAHLVLALSAVAALFLAVVPPRNSRSGDFVARGAALATSDAKLLVYRLGHGQPPQSLGTTLQPSDELAFAYSNPGGYKRLMIFGVDEHGHVYWYHPEWSDAATDPHAIEIQPGGEVHELPAAISHSLDGSELHLFAVFMNEDLSVRGIEKMMQERNSSADPLPLTTAVVKEVLLRVER